MNAKQTASAMRSAADVLMKVSNALFVENLDSLVETLDINVAMIVHRELIKAGFKVSLKESRDKIEMTITK